VTIFYAILAVAGAIIPYAQFVPWAAEHGLDAKGFALELFSTRIGAFFGLDVFVSAGRRAKMKKLWMPVAATLLVGVSCGLPLFLFLRELKLTKEEK